MRRRFNFVFLIYGCWLFFSLASILKLNAFAEEPLKINLNKELKKGNFLIGLKQYVGAYGENFLEEQNITFETKNDFLELHSFDGFKHKSKNIKIIFKQIPLKKPLTIERLVFGPFASYESAQRKSKKLKQKGHEAVVAYPKNWEVWLPVSEKLPDQR